MPAPAAYIVPTKEPNAFAAGRGRDRVVAVTQGLVDLLDRRELEAVVAHEVGHLKHGDTGRAAQAAAMLSGLSTAKRAGDRMLANKRKEKSDASVAAALAAAGAASSAAGLLLRLASIRAKITRAMAWRWEPRRRQKNHNAGGKPARRVRRGRRRRAVRRRRRAGGRAQEDRGHGRAAGQAARAGRRLRARVL